MMHPNLVDQLRVFLAVADAGTFSGAAQKLGRAVSAVSYAVTNLEEAYGLKLFDRSGYKPQLTEEGRALLSDTDIVFRRLDRLNARVSAIRAGDEVDIALAVDAGFSTALLATATARMTAESPHVNLRIHMMPEARVMEEVHAGAAQIGLVSLEAGLSGKHIDGRDIATHDTHIVAAPGHPLAALNAPFPLSALDDHRQIVLADQQVASHDFDYRVHTTDVLIVDNIALKTALLKQGAGWGYALDHEVEGALVDGTLKSLECAAIQHPGIHRFGAVWRVTTPPGPAAGRLLDLISEAAEAREKAAHRRRA
jgi:DNA-binding transcriptional LysR family regulator